MKVYMMTDLEGVAGVVSFGSQTAIEGRYYDQAKRLLTAEINAAIEGLVGVGVDDVLVHDGHGPGAVWYEDLHPVARLLHGRPAAPFQTISPFVKECDACIMVGQHAMAGVATGNLNHTQSSDAVDSYKLNGRPIGEIAQFALFMGGFGIPLIFLSGDDEACNEAEALIPGITTVSVKTGLSRNSAISLAAIESRRRIREGTVTAIQQQRQDAVAPLTWKGPYILEKRFFHTDTAGSLLRDPGVERVDAKTVRYRANNIQEIIYR